VLRGVRIVKQINRKSRRPLFARAKRGANMLVHFSDEETKLCRSTTTDFEPQLEN